MDFVTLRDVWTFRDILNKLENLLNTKPDFTSARDGEVRLVVPNPSKIGYTDLVEVFIYERYAQIKIRNPSKLVEHQLDLLPWMMGLNYYIWDDNEYEFEDVDAGIVISSTIAHHQHIKFTDTEEEYFQRMTQQDNSFFTMEELRDAKLLMNRMYEYFNIIPVPQEQ